MSKPFFPSRFGLGHKWRSVRVLATNLLRVRRRHGVGAAAQLRTYRIMREATGASPEEFYVYRLWDPAIPLVERLTVLTWAIRRPLEAHMNPNGPSMMVRSKVDADRHFRELGLPVPDRLGVWCPVDRLEETADGIADVERLRALLKRCRDGVVFKREVGGGGDFVLVFHDADPDALRHASGEQWSFERLRAMLADGERWLLQRRLRCHPDLVALIGRDELASVRFLTCRRRDGRIFMPQAMLKLPATNSGLDNFAAGNVAVAVDETGRLGGAVLGINGPLVTRHPHTDAVLADRVVPYWSAALDLVLRGHSGLPAVLRSLGWDVAITSAGPVVLEANTWWGDQTQQPGLRGLVRGEFAEFVEELGAGSLVRLERRRRAAGGQLPAPRAARLITLP